ncbi:GntR family transcriptional regulator [Streptomyces sp. NBC_00154]|uniref:GntR family transcriptional regulator n=1 Tax=Streptomyces sp. NBC_00154 TaxID=2975670 RepID=UPI00224FBB3E|nr:winged helix-turn-helix domain-containing protein [Streptomyces sp. NBC_00154]MCX5312834.1 winged helix-turn-helix domain-containing protein [Streptomyces sp. NBC_00154]
MPAPEYQGAVSALGVEAVTGRGGPRARNLGVWTGLGIAAAAVITARIANGAYPVGGKVPSVVELSTEFGIAASTAQKALTHLKAEGLIRTEVGLGSFVADGPS